jgi:hypothetical protein
VAGEEDLFLVVEVVIQVPLLHVERGGNLFDGRAVVAEPTECGGRALEDLGAGVGGSGRAPRAFAAGRPQPSFRVGCG